MLTILKINMKAGNYFRVLVEANDEMKAAWLDFFNRHYNNGPKMTFETAMEKSCYLSNDEGFLVMEVEIKLGKRESYVSYFFDEYEVLDVNITDEEYEQCIAFINEWKNLLPDNEKMGLGDDEWYDLIPDTVPWK